MLITVPHYTRIVEVITDVLVILVIEMAMD